METVEDIPVALEPEAVAKRLRIGRDRSGPEGLAELIGFARGLIRARAVHDVVFVGEKGEGTVEAGGVVFQSLILRRNLEAVNKIFPFIITVGPELERAAGARGDLLVQYYLEEIADMALESAAQWLGASLEARHGLGSLSSLSPGSLEDWPITEQGKLFSLFGDTERLVGVRLTDSLLMVPRKSISGILFPSEEGFVACELCDRGHCPSRKAAFRAGPQET